MTGIATPKRSPQWTATGILNYGPVGGYFALGICSNRSWKNACNDQLDCFKDVSRPQRYCSTKLIIVQAVFLLIFSVSMTTIADSESVGYCFCWSFILVEAGTSCGAWAVAGELSPDSAAVFSSILGGPPRSVTTSRFAVLFPVFGRD